MRINSVPAASCLMGLCLATAANAGEIDKAFAAKLAALPPGTKAPAVIYLHEQLDIQSLDRRLELGNASRWMRHYQVVSQAQALAARTQPPVLALAGLEQARGTVSDVQPFWIINAIGLKGTPAALAALAALPQVMLVDDGDAPIEIIAPVGPVVPDVALPFAMTVEPGLIGIRADILWNLGFLGQGRIVSSLDTGVTGTHVAYNTRWRGLEPGVAVSAAWHSPTLHALTPTDSNGHGTHTMGTMCGDDGTNRVGVAPMAKWIASDSIAGSNLGQVRIDAIAGFQWSADPDNNALTVNDAPDVSSNSWGFSPFFHGVPMCDNAFWGSIDVCDASGCAVVFAAGNEASSNGGVMNLRTPADRATSETNCFSVGALNVDQATIAGFSSRGPSGCPGNPIKPEVCAQGNNVRSSIRPSGYGNLSGTSMACPHVAGAVALLRQVDPNLSSARVKRYIFDSADDLGAAGNDNTFGMGRVNLERAYNAIIADRDRVTVGAVTTRYNVRQGDILPIQINVINHTAADVPTVLFMDIVAVGQPGALPMILPFPVVIGAGTNLDPNWPTVGFQIPTGLPPVFLTYQYQVKFTAFDPVNNRTMSVALADFRIVP